MYVYTLGQWLLFFFLYCFLGWVWESCYVSARQRRWVNRGFLHGPLLPIYGFGAVIILWATLPVRQSLPLIFLLGMLAATALEYVTGAAMEALFKVRYWDYSGKPFNLNGHICLSSSIAWGFFSILLVRCLHPPVGRLLGDIPSWCVDPLALVLTVAFTVDVVRSVQAALDLREMLTKLTEENEDLRRLAKRAEVAAAFAEDDLRRFRERTEVEKLLLQDRIQAEIAEQRQAREARKHRRREREEASLRRRTDARLDALAAIADALERGRAGNEGQEVPPLARITIDNMVDIVQRQRRCVEELLAAVVGRLDGFVSLACEDFPALLDRYRQRCLTLGRQVRASGGQCAEGLAVDVNGEGELLVKTMEGELVALRTADGLDIAEYRSNFGSEFVVDFFDALSKNKEYFDFDGRRVRIKDEFLYVQNQILCDFIE